ncbi:hypothetical protein EC912_10345 [Luteibacter rhizovicinus]|uniref:Uncharacterized protein n=2 Tax=Luteibacter rhizovicinus TaxID=242606 RepID=A0A4R3YQE8_9GAMM|nr:hypothetical protein EC912_10345 [Luteibacter rhizovicinus]
MVSILTLDFASIRQGIKLLDWIGFDHYGDSDNTWTNTMNSLKSYAPGKKYIVVPGSMTGCPDVTIDNPTRFLQSMSTDPDVVWLAPFAWFSVSATCKGVRGIPSLRSTYTNEGLSIKAQQCNSSLGAKQFCGMASNIAAINYLLGD